MQALPAPHSRPPVQFFSIWPKALLTAPRVEKAFDAITIINNEKAHLFASPIRVKMWSKGRGWPDFLNPYTSLAPVICSQRVKDVIIAESLKGVRFIPVTLEPEKPGRPLGAHADYFWIIPEGAPLPYYLKAYHARENQYTPWFTAESLNDPRLSAWLHDGSEDPATRKVPIVERWDGSDLMKWSDEKWVAGGRMACSRRFVEIAYREKWTNLCVAPMDHIEDGHRNLCELAWPPEQWYSSNHPSD